MHEEKLKVVVERFRVRMDPEIIVIAVEVSTEGGCWRETFGSEPELKMFLRGLQCGCWMSGPSVVLSDSVTDNGAIQNWPPTPQPSPESLSAVPAI